MKCKIQLISLLLLFFLMPMAFGFNHILNIQLTSHHHFWRIVVDSNQQKTIHQFGLTHPYRLVLDFEETVVNPVVIQHFKADGPVKSLRFSSHGLNTRLVFDLTKNWPVNNYRQFACSQNGCRIGIDIHTFDNAIPSSQKTMDIVSTKKTISTTNNKNLFLKPVLSMPQLSISQPQARNIIVMIDPGHGGKDPGATGVEGGHEKEVVLKIAKKLQSYLNQQKGFVAKLTRTGDYYLTLRQRLNIAREKKSDVFVSIHADAYNNKTANGASVYALSPRGATSEAARWLAERENRSELMGGVSLADKGNILRSVLIDLSQTATIGSSLKIGEQLLMNLHQVTPLHHAVVEQAAFVVLKSPDIPSILVETGFMSSQRESGLLSTSVYQAKIATAIMQGIKQYFIQHPPPATYLAAMEEKDFRYYVKPGDSLARLAKQFNLKMQQLASVNSLLITSQLAVGQVLLIPRKSA